MAAPKGHKYATGRPKGSKNKAGKEIKGLVQEMFDMFKDDIPMWVTKVAHESPEKAYKMLFESAEYAFPKLSRQEVTGKDGKDLIPEPTKAQLSELAKQLSKYK